MRESTPKVSERIRISDWTADYGKGARPCKVPHAWRQDVDVRWEGPATYRAQVSVPVGSSWLIFHGVSYEAKVFADDESLGEHRGIWDAFSFPLEKFAGRKVALRVDVVKNGGATYPVKDVASGFLPYVFNTFGGIYQDVEIVLGSEDPLQSKIQNPKSKIPRVRVEETKIFVDGKPLYLRAPLTWGWYPDLGHTNPPEETIRKEVRQAKEMGFNTMKFCLWVPPHRYFEVLSEEGMFAWLELPLWDPTPDPEKQEAMFPELERIVRQYRHHDNIIVWTCGCELSSNTTAEFRERLYKMVKELTGSPLVKDNSGGSEMYGGDLREFGDFYDFHPYCDLPFYPQVLDSLLIGPRKKMPILLGEFNDVDVFRDLARLRKERPYWTSSDPYLNDQGVRWQHDLPRAVEESRFALEAKSSKSDYLRRASLLHAEFIREGVQETVAGRPEIAGHVVTGWRDTPISSSGYLDVWGDLKPWGFDYGHKEEDFLFPIPMRRPPWIDGGNRPGWIDPFNYFEGEISLKIGLRTTHGIEGCLEWEAQRDVFFDNPITGQGRNEIMSVGALEAREVGQLNWLEPKSGGSILRVEFGPLVDAWGINVYKRPEFEHRDTWSVSDPCGHLGGVRLEGVAHVLSTAVTNDLTSCQKYGNFIILLLTIGPVNPSPFWREAAYEFDLGLPNPKSKIQNPKSPLAWLDNNWEALLPISPDRVIDLDALYSHLPKKAEIRTLINRIDTRTYKEAPIMVEVRCGKGRMLATTLRPYGGLGCQPYGVMNNPAGAALLESMMRYLEEGD